MAGEEKESRTAPESPLVYTLFPFSSSEETKPCALTRVLILDYKTHRRHNQEAKLGMIALLKGVINRPTGCQSSRPRKVEGT